MARASPVSTTASAMRRTHPSRNRGRASCSAAAARRAEADIVNIIPPTGGATGRIAVDDALKFDMGEFRRRVDLLAAQCKQVGRDISEIELSGMVYIMIGRTEEEADTMARVTA